MPGISHRPVPSAAFTALGIPSVVSWSVKAMAARPLLTASLTSSSGGGCSVREG